MSAGPDRIDTEAEFWFVWWPLGLLLLAVWIHVASHPPGARVPLLPGTVGTAIAAFLVVAAFVPPVADWRGWWDL